MAERKPAPSRQPVLTWASPSVADLIFFVEQDATLPENRRFAYGDPHPDKAQFPHHKLVFVSPQDGERWSRWFYAADRENEDNYNFEFTGEQLTRSYLVLRDKYFARTEAQAKLVDPPLSGEFTRPVVGTADTRFADFVYAEDSLARTESELDSLYVLVRRAYVPASLVSYQFDDTLQRTVKITRRVVPAKTVTGSGTYGRQVEIQPQNIFHDFEITSEVMWLPGDLDGSGNVRFPIQLDSVAAEVNYQFPLLLKSIKLFGAWALATSSAPPDYAEDFFFENDIAEPSPGPYDATVLRFLTDNPDAVRAAYPTDTVTARAETFGIVKWWAVAHDRGNRAFALAKQYDAPASVHDEIELPGIINYAQGGSRSDSGFGPGSQTLPATPGFAAYIASTTTIAGVDTRRSRLGLWEVQVTRINAGGATVYNNDQASSRTLRPGTGTTIFPVEEAVLAVKTLSIYPILADQNATVAPSHLGGTYQIGVWSKPEAMNITGPINTGDIELVASSVTWAVDVPWISSTEPPVFNPYFKETGRTTYPFKLTYAANGTGVERRGTIVFTNTRTKAKQTFTLVQPG
jgi:hypothetical protein